MSLNEVLDPNIVEDEESSLRPVNFDEYIGQTNLKENLKSESYSVISSTSPELKFKFKIIEFFKQNELFTAKNNSSESK